MEGNITGADVEAHGAPGGDKAGGRAFASTASSISSLSPAHG